MNPSVARANWRIGPFHAALPGPFQLNLQLDGDVISSAEVFVGFSHRNIVGALKKRSWLQGIILMDRLDPDAAIFTEWAYCSAVEKLSGMLVPPRAQVIRSLLAETTRISAHLKQLALVARAAGAETAFHFLLRERECVLDLLELGTGSRHMPVFFRFGGVREDISEGFLERLDDVCTKINTRMEEYEDLLTSNEIFFQRALGCAVLSKEIVRKHGITGVPARAHESIENFRWAEQKRVVLGDLYHRFLLKLGEIQNSIEILKERAHQVPSGPFGLDGEVNRIPRGEASAAVDAPRGRLQVSIVSNGSDHPAGVRLEAPSEALIRAVPEVLVGTPVEDLALCLASLDIQIGEVDQ